MAYAVPPRWAQGDYPTATNLNKYKDALDDLHTTLGDAKLNRAVLWNYRNVDGTNFALSNAYMIHRQRWLIYRGDGDLVDPSGAGDTVTISGDGTNLVTYDLEQVNWLYPGKLYQLEDFVFAVEDSEA